MNFPTPVIVGPTAGGKTSLAVGLARSLASRGVAAEILSADSALIYRGMNIGTAKPTAEERGGIPHHLIDLFEPDGNVTFSVHDWIEAAHGLIADLRSRNVLPIVVGGTHLYVKALLEGMFEGPKADPELRAGLMALPAEELRAKLIMVDPEAASRIHANDIRRTVRALEVFELTGTPITSLQKQWVERSDNPADDARFAIIGLDWPIDAINRRINARVRGMFEAGLEAEVHALWLAGRLGPQAREALGYKQLLVEFERAKASGLTTSPLPPAALERAVEEIKIETRRFGKNQRTWLKRLRLSRVAQLWIDAASESADTWVSRAESFLHGLSRTGP